MKACIKNLFTRLGGASCAAWACLGVASMRSRVLPALIAGLGLISAGRVTAQTSTTLHSFTNGIDGANPQAGLILSGTTLYGTAAGGGSFSNGTVFAVNTDGTGFTNLYILTALSNSTNSDGANPYAGLILSGNTLYGTAGNGGSSGRGTVFAVNTNGTGFTNPHNFTALTGPLFTNSDGATPAAGLILSGNILYGTAILGGSSGAGTVFKVNTDGSGFTNLYSFTGGSDGAIPNAGLILSGNTLYGTARLGGSAGNGTVFKLNTNGTGFTRLHSFTVLHGSPPENSDGATPYGGLILSGNTLYGTAWGGGISGNGTVFKLNTDGTVFTTLHSFTAGSFNSDGANPFDELILSGNTLYGTAFNGGSSGNGTVFAVNTNGTSFTNLHSFAGFPSDGSAPVAGLILSGNTLYGTAWAGGSSGNGTVFSLPLPVPRLTIISSGANVILTWPTNAAGFTLQSATNLVSPAVWSTVAQAPVVINGLNTFIRPISGTRKFYRLSQ